MIKLIVFDCDGVMFDSMPANREYYNHLLRHFDKPDMDEKELAYVHIHNVADCISHIFRNHPDVLPKAIEEFRKQLDYAVFLPHFVMEPDLVEFLETVKNRYKLGISTNRSDTMELLLDSFKLSNYFGKVMTAANTSRSKPAPDGMLEILDFFGISAKETIFIGDSMVDQLHAEASGTQLIAFKNKELKTEFHVNSFMEILELPLMKQD